MGSAGHCHHHHHHHSHATGPRLGWVIAFNLLITLGQVIAGFISGSLALLSDAMHNFGDVVSLCVSYVAEALSARKSTPSETFGYKRAEIVAAIFNASSLLAVGLLLTKEAVVRLIHPEPILPLWVMAFAALGALTNGASVVALWKDRRTNFNLRSAFLHLLADFFTSLGVLLGGAVMYVYQVYWLDSILTIAIACFFVYSSWGLLLASLRVIMHFTPAHVDVMAVEKVFMAEPLVSNIHHVHVWQLTDRSVHLEAHVDFKEDIPLSATCAVIARISKVLTEKFHISHLIIQPEIGVEDSKSLIANACSHKE